MAKAGHLREYLRQGGREMDEWRKGKMHGQVKEDRHQKLAGVLRAFVNTTYLGSQESITLFNQTYSSAQLRRRGLLDDKSANNSHPVLVVPRTITNCHRGKITAHNKSIQATANA